MDLGVAHDLPAPGRPAPESIPLPPMTPKTCKAARMLLSISQADLATRANISIQTLRNYENEESAPLLPTWHAIKRVLEQAGVQFIDDGETSGGGGVGLRLRERSK
jgi:DNA-binding XRE family transcriptional regulator